MLRDQALWRAESLSDQLDICPAAAHALKAGLCHGSRRQDQVELGQISHIIQRGGARYQDPEDLFTPAFRFGERWRGVENTGFHLALMMCPVPVVITGDKKLPESEAMEMAYRAIGQGAAGADMARKLFQVSGPVATLRALAILVQEGRSGAAVYKMYCDLAERQTVRHLTACG